VERAAVWSSGPVRWLPDRCLCKAPAAGRPDGISNEPWNARFRHRDRSNMNRDLKIAPTVILPALLRRGRDATEALRLRCRVAIFGFRSG
jgi:hypothetical protein